MQQCSQCNQKTPDRSCLDCDYFMSPGSLRRKPPAPIRISLVTSDGRRYGGRILVLNTMELGLETNAPVPGKYRIYLQQNLSLDVAGVPTRGKSNMRLFDILAVYRDQETATRLGSEEYALLTGSTGDFIEQVSQLVPAHLQDLVKERLLAEIQNSEILNAMQVGRVLRYEKGRLRHLGGQADLELPPAEIEKLVRKAIRQGAHCRELIVSSDGQRVFDLHGIPLDPYSGGLLAFDITEIINKERQMRRQEMLAYQEAIAAVTNGRLRLWTLEEMAPLLSQGHELARGEVQKAADVALARSKLRSLLPAIFHDRQHGIYLCLTEALTNALKHAGGGEWVARHKDETLRIIVQDHGQGIKLKDLPKATLLQHYSTKESLGCGFTLMLYYTDKLYLATGNAGTTLVLNFCQVAGQKAC
ncbi:ATP-binding protein [Moorella sp. Hama-1]|uniref:ATP-binding protein n=1 Tax=Moorella sp. Hama-1 TaxID=2138101 RepID=UPI000D646E69|nr:ATP-binding protein [Moorella sp. Hama-1]BCV21086.1 anti-sigma regulatory factor [Moorella sp. Hama-1]